jgi:hypothetical protein
MITLRGMYGFGDCIHQRAVVREVMKEQPVILETFYRELYHDLVDNGLKLKMINGHAPRMRERVPLRNRHTDFKSRGPTIKINYDHVQIKRTGSILAAQFDSVGMVIPDKADFSIPVKLEWREWARKVVGPVNKPLLVYRPIVLNNLWKSESRAPDPALYSALFRSIRDRYHVVSIANIGDHGEYIVGETYDADTNFNRGELDFETLAGLLSISTLVFTCPGVGAVLSQAMGAKTVIVYGANECHRTTNSVGNHLAQTLAIEPDLPCDHHLKECGCSKHITLPPAIARLEQFVCRS